MSNIEIYHNPRCSKSRQTLALLEENGVSPTVVEYLKVAPTVDTLNSIYASLGFDSVRDMMRTKEAEYKEMGLSDSTLTDAQLVSAIHQCPKLLERPIVINGDKAKIGRPPEQVLEIV